MLFVELNHPTKMKYIVAASLFAALVSAQSIPPCALTCAINQVTKSEPDFKKDPKNCPTLPSGTNALTDTDVQKCLCKTTSFQTAFAECAKNSGCSPTEQCDLWKYSSSLCSGFGPDYALSDSLEPAICKSGGGGGSGGGSSAAPPPPAETSQPAETGSAPPAETTAPAQSSGAPAETSAPAESSGAGAPPSYGSPSTVATSAAAGASGAPSTTPTYVPSSGSTVVLSGAAAVLAGLAALLAL